MTPGAAKLFDKNSSREVVIPIDEVGIRSVYNRSDHPETAQNVEQSHAEDGEGASSSGALERPKQFYDLSARTGSTKTGPIFSQKEKE